MKAVFRLFLIYGIPFTVIVIVDKLPNAQGYTGPVIFGCIAWMFGLYFLLKGGEQGDRDS